MRPSTSYGSRCRRPAASRPRRASASAAHGLLLEVDNVFVSATNHGYSAHAYLAAFPLERVSEIHLAGHSKQRGDEGAPLLIDSHDRAVADSVWTPYQDVMALTGPCGARRP